MFLLKETPRVRGPMSKIMSMIPGMPQGMTEGSDGEISARMKRMMIICDSMTEAELDSDGSPFIIFDPKEKTKPIDVNMKRLIRLSRGSGAPVREIEDMLCQYRMMSNVAKTVGGKNGM